MILGVRNVYYNVRNLKEAVRFYTEVLGLRLVLHEEKWANLELSGVRVGLYWTGGDDVPNSPRGKYGNLIGATLSLTSSNIEEDKQKLLNANTIVLDEMEESFGKVLLFQDPDGNVLRLVQPSDH